MERWCHHGEDDSDNDRDEEVRDQGRDMKLKQPNPIAIITKISNTTATAANYSNSSNSKQVATDKPGSAYISNHKVPNIWCGDEDDDRDEEVRDQGGDLKLNQPNPITITTKISNTTATAANYSNSSNSKQVATAKAGYAYISNHKVPNIWCGDEDDDRDEEVRDQGGDLKLNQPNPITITTKISNTTATAANYSNSSNSKQVATAKPGYAYIFNHVTFDNTQYGRRDGTEKDVEALQEIFISFQMNVEVIENAERKKIKDMVEIIETKDFSSLSYIVIVILSHGTRHDKIRAKDKEYSIYDDVLFPIFRNKTLERKPKLLFIQACKGDMEYGYESDGKSSSWVGTPSKTLIFYSTFEGSVSYRCSFTGSLFIQALCDILKQYGRKEDIMEIVQKVRKAVEDGKSGQYPATYSTLDRFCFGDYLNAKS